MSPRKKLTKARTPRRSNVVVSDFVQNPVIVGADDSVVDAARLMRDHQVGSVIVSENPSKDSIGILTEWDLLSRVIAEGKNPSRMRVREAMSSPLRRVDANTRVEDAMRIMINQGIRRLGVTEDGALIGIITQSQVIGNRKTSSSPLPIVEPIEGFGCPYCNSSFLSRRLMDKHIGDVHKETVKLERKGKKELQRNEEDE